MNLSGKFLDTMIDLSGTGRETQNQVSLSFTVRNEFDETFKNKNLFSFPDLFGATLTAEIFKTWFLCWATSVSICESWIRFLIHK